MRILLLSMPDLAPNSEDSMILPSLGIASLAGNIDLDAHQVKIADLVLRRKDYWHFLEELLQKEHPQLVGLSGLTYSVQTALKVAEFIKQRWPTTYVVLGGYMALCHDDELTQPSKAQWIDFIVRGEGELTFRELLEELEGKRRFERVDGLSFKSDGQFIHNPRRELADLAEIRLPTRTARIVDQGFHILGKPADVVETSRGCPFDCSFCCVSQQYYRTYRAYPLDRVLSDIEVAYSIGTRAIFLVDDNITTDLERLDALCEELIHSSFRGLSFAVQAAVKPIANSPDLVQKMNYAGIDVIWLGLENVIERNLHFMNKKTSSYEWAERAVRNLRKNHIISIVSIILGNPDDRKEDLWRNYHLVRSLQVDIAPFLILTPFPKTRVRQELKQRGLLTNPDDYSRYDLFQANVRTQFLTEQELSHFVRLLYRKYHLSTLLSNQLLRKYRHFALKHLLNELIHWLSCRIKSLLRKELLL